MDRGELLCELLAGGMALVPYDAAPNHEPDTGRGHRAHWAALRGFVVRLPAVPAGVDAQPDTEVPELMHCAPVVRNREQAQTLADAVLQALEADDSLFVLAQHGKSKWEGAWSFAALRR